MHARDQYSKVFVLCFLASNIWLLSGALDHLFCDLELGAVLVLS